MLTHEYIESVTPIVINKTHVASADAHVIEFKDATIVCGVYIHKGYRVVLIKSCTDDQGVTVKENLHYEYLDFIHELGVVCLEVFKTPFMEWGDLYNLVRYNKFEYEQQGIELELKHGRKVVQHAIGGNYFIKDLAGNYLKVTKDEIQDRINQYKRLGIPASIPEWVLVRVPDKFKNYNYRRLRDVLSDKKFLSDKKYREEALAFLE